MKLEKGILGLLIAGMLISNSLIVKNAHAVIYADESPSAGDNGDDENADAVSRFGVDPSAQSKHSSKELKPLDPISEESFGHTASRGIASVTEDENPKKKSRKPAAVPHATKKQAMRVAKRDKAYQEVALIANDNGFFPSTVFLTQGIPARIFITGASAKSQCFMLDQFGVRRQVRNQKIEEVTFVPDQIGTFTFNCPMNGARGNVIVKEWDVESAKAVKNAAAGKAQDSVEDAPAGSPALTPRSAPQAEITASVRGPASSPKKSDIHDDDFAPEFR